MAPGSRTSAFTFPEALVTMGLMLFFAALVGGVLFQGRTMADRTDRHDRFIQDKVSLASYLPALCQAVTPPEWMAQDQVFSQSAEGLVVKYWNADPEQKVTFAIVDGALQVKTPQGSWSWKTLNPMAVEWWKSADRIVGLVVHWTETGSQRSLHLLWGGRPL